MSSKSSIEMPNSASTLMAHDFRNAAGIDRMAGSLFCYDEDVPLSVVSRTLKHQTDGSLHSFVVLSPTVPNISKANGDLTNITLSKDCTELINHFISRGTAGSRFFNNVKAPLTGDDAVLERVLAENATGWFLNVPSSEFKNAKPASTATIKFPVPYGWETEGRVTAVTYSWDHSIPEDPTAESTSTEAGGDVSLLWEPKAKL
jgi:hypothetical protein